MGHFGPKPVKKGSKKGSKKGYFGPFPVINRVKSGFQGPKMAQKWPKNGSLFGPLLDQVWPNLNVKTVVSGPKPGQKGVKNGFSFWPKWVKNGVILGPILGQFDAAYKGFGAQKWVQKWPKKGSKMTPFFRKCSKIRTPFWAKNGVILGPLFGPI